MNKEDLLNFVNKFIEATQESDYQKYKPFFEQLELEKYDNPEDFYFGLVYPFETLLSTYIQTLYSSQDITFIFKEYRFLENHITKLFEQYEGFSFSADKSSFIIKSLIHHFKTGDDIILNKNQEFTYHLPKKILTTQDEILSFYDSLKHLYYGNSDLYVTEIRSLERL